VHIYRDRGRIITTPRKQKTINLTGTTDFYHPTCIHQTLNPHPIANKKHSLSPSSSKKKPDTNRHTRESPSRIKPTAGHHRKWQPHHRCPSTSTSSQETKTSSPRYVQRRKISTERPRGVSRIPYHLPSTTACTNNENPRSKPFSRASLSCATRTST
jgi:hypothetical protein